MDILRKRNVDVVGGVRAVDAIELDGDDLTRMPIHVRARLGLSYLPQEASVFRKLSVSDNLTAVLELRSDLVQPREIDADWADIILIASSPDSQAETLIIQACHWLWTLGLWAPDFGNKDL